MGCQATAAVIHMQRRLQGEDVRLLAGFRFSLLRASGAIPLPLGLGCQPHTLEVEPFYRTLQE